MASNLEFRLGRPRPRPLPFESAPAPLRRRIVAVGGGKGGVGKSLLTSSLAISLARRGRRVVVVDGDLGGANVHTALGIATPSLTLADFIHHRVGSIEDVITETGIANLGLISGARDYLTASNLKYLQKKRLLAKVRAVEADYILLDLGAGISFNIVDFFLLAETGVLVVVPDPSSIENCYRFLKMSFYRNLWMAVNDSVVRAVIDQAMDEKNRRGIRSPFDLIEAVERICPQAGTLLRQRAQSFRPRLLVNQGRFTEDERLGVSMANVCRRHLGVSMELLGVVPYDDRVWQASRRKQPFVLAYPESDAARTIDRAASRLLGLVD